MTTIGNINRYLNISPLTGVQTILDYADALLENSLFYSVENINATTMRQALVSKVYQLSSANWISNKGIYKTFSEEYHQSGFEDNYLSWYACFLQVITEWLSSKRAMWVINNLQLNHLYYNRLMEVDLLSDPYKINFLTKFEQCTDYSAFKDTISQLEAEYQLERDYYSFLGQQNRDTLGNVYPITFILDPDFFTLTFVH